MVYVGGMPYLEAKNIENYGLALVNLWFRQRKYVV